MAAPHARGAPHDDREGAPVTDADTRTVEQTLRINARPETVWRYWTDPQRMCDWWGTAAELEPRPGGICRVDMGGGAVVLGEYVELVPHERIVFTFGWEPTPSAPDVAPGSTRVEVTLTADDGDTIMTLRHTGLPAAAVEAHDAGWGHFLPLLVAAVEEASS
jgi:uncharacterized protein YndB with AHSA1/START domain